MISVAGVAEGGLGPVGVGGAAHLVGDLDGDLLAHGPGHLPGVLVRHLLALSVHLLLALGGAGVALAIAGFSLSLPLTVSVTMRDNLGVVTNNSGAVVNLLADLAAVLGHDVGALLDVGGVHHKVVLLMAHVLVVGLALLVVDGVVDHVALDVVPLAVTMTTMTTMRGLSHWGGQSGSGEEEGGADSVHHDADTKGSISSHQLCKGGAEANCVDLAQIGGFYSFDLSRLTFLR